VVVDKGRCLHLNARTGETCKTYMMPHDAENEAPQWAWIAMDADRLYGSRAEVELERRKASEQTSDVVFALDRSNGETLWTFRGRGIDHGAIAVAAGHVFLIDRTLTDAQRQQAMDRRVNDHSIADRNAVDRRGQAILPDVRKLVKLEATSGDVVWQIPLDVTDVTLDDLIVQGKGGVACMVKDGVVVVHGPGSLGHPHKEFLDGEFARRALYAFDALSGDLLWGGRKGYRKRPIIVGDHVYAEPFAWHLKTGEMKMIDNPLSGEPQALDFHRGYIGCGHLLGSASTLFGAKQGVGYFNLDESCGFTPFGGVALACGLGAVPANGVLVVPEGRSGCTCDVPIHTSMAVYPKPSADAWSVGFTAGRANVAQVPTGDVSVKRVSVNLGAPGYRQDAQGDLWIPYPTRIDNGLLGDWLPTYEHDSTMCYRLSDLMPQIEGTDAPWVFASGYVNEKPLRFRLTAEGESAERYTVRLFFAEPRNVEPGQRVFSVLLQGKTVLDAFDPVKAAGSPRRGVVREFRSVEVQGLLEIQLRSSPHAAVTKPVLCGFQAIRE